MSEYRITHDHRAIEVVTHLSAKCELNVDGHRVDSGVAPARGGTMKLQDTESGIVVNVTYGLSLHPDVILLADGRQIPLPRQ